MGEDEATFRAGNKRKNEGVESRRGGVDEVGGEVMCAKVAELRKQTTEGILGSSVCSDVEHKEQPKHCHESSRSRQDESRCEEPIRQGRGQGNATASEPGVGNDVGLVPVRNGMTTWRINDVPLDARQRKPTFNLCPRRPSSASQNFITRTTKKTK